MVQYLDPAQRTAAPCLFKALDAARDAYLAAVAGTPDATVDAELLIRAAILVLRSEPLFEAIEYVSVSSMDNFEELTTVGSDGAVLSAAVQIGKTRLLDNIII